MALADYYQRDALAIAQVLGHFDEDRFRSTLTPVRVGLAFGSTAAERPEGRALLELTVRLLARLYPTLALLSGQGAEAQADELMRLARLINPHIEIAADHPTIAIAVGEDAPPTGCATVHAGSDGWDAHISNSTHLSVGMSQNPLGAGAAACLAAANVFRWVFLADREELLDCHATLSVLDRAAAKTEAPLTLDHVSHGGATVLVGAGAVGEAALWAFSRISVPLGTLHIVDDEAVDLGNLQRYVLTDRESVGKLKVELAAEALKDVSGLRVVPQHMDWSTFLEYHGYAWDRVLVALDSAEGRRAVQAALPRWIANAWTQPGDLGLSTHRFGGPRACLNCLYLPADGGESQDMLVSRALGIPDRMQEVRDLLYKGAPPPPPLLQLIAKRLDVPLDRLRPFADRPIDALYVEGICGGAVIPFRGKGAPEARMHVPLAHQSALAGILLAGALLADVVGRTASSTRLTQIDLLKPLGTVLTHNARQDPDGICICQDSDYLAVYRDKYPA